MNSWSSLALLVVVSGCAAKPTPQERRANAGPGGEWIALTGLVTQRCAIADVAHGGAAVSIVEADGARVFATQTTTPDGKFSFRIPRDVRTHYELRVGDHREVLPDGEWLSFQARVSVPCDTGSDPGGHTVVQLFGPDASKGLRDYDSAIRSPDGVQSPPEEARDRARVLGR